MNGYPDLSRSRLRNFLVMGAGVALLVGVTLAATGKLPLPERVRVAVENITRTQEPQAAAVAYWAREFGAAEGGTLPAPKETGGVPGSGFQTLYGCYQSCGDAKAYCSNDTKLGVISISDPAGESGKAAAVTRQNVQSVSGTGMVVNGQTVKLDWACQSYQKITYVNTEANYCPTSGSQTLDADDLASTATVSGPGITTINDTLENGANNGVTGSTQFVVSGTAGQVLNYTLQCKRATDNYTWTATVPITISNAVLNISANPDSVYYGGSSEVTWSASNVVANSCSINGGGIANDDSGNNEFNPNALGSVDQLLDTPTNNFATLESGPWGGGGYLLKFAFSGSNPHVKAAAFPMTSGKWYWEVKIDSMGNSDAFYVGMWRALSPLHNGNAPLGANTMSLGVRANNGYLYYNGLGPIVGAYVAGNTVMVAFDADAGKIWFGRQGAWFGSGNPATGANPATTGLTQGDWMPAVAIKNGQVTMNFGQGGQSGVTYRTDAGGSFLYAPPAGFKALSSENYPTPTITEPRNYFDVATWVGNATNNRAIALDMEPDLVWVKSRSGGNLAHNLYDAVRGLYLYLLPNYVNPHTADATTLRGFNTNGFTVGVNTLVNALNASYVGWAWQESPAAGFDIVQYTGDGTASRDVAHGLGAAPDMVIAKGVSISTDWYVWHQGMGNMTSALELNTTNNVTTTITPNSPWASGNFNASTFRVQGAAGNTMNTSGHVYNVYLFKDVEGFSKFGTYTGNGSNTGPVVYTGFRPKYILLRNISGGANWVVVDAERGAQKWFEFSNTSPAETSWTSPVVEFRDNGFRITIGSNVFNQSGNTFMYAAFAERPYKYSGGASAGLSINNSLQFHYNTPTAILSRTPSVSGNRAKFTASVWFKPGALYLTGQDGVYQGHAFFGKGTQTSWDDNGTPVYYLTGDYLMLDADGQLEFRVNGTTVLRTEQTFTKNDWQHAVLTFDSANAVSTLRARLYVDGREITDFTIDNRANLASLNATQTSEWNVAGKANYIGTAYSGAIAGNYFGFDGLLADMYFLDGYVVAPTSFAQEDSQGYWRPIEYLGPRGTNGFHLKFENAYPSPFTVSNITEPRTFTLQCISSTENAPVSKSITIGLKPPLIAASSSNATFGNASNPAKYFDANDITTYSRVAENAQGKVSWRATGAQANSCNMTAYPDGAASYAVAPANTNDAWNIAVTATASTTFTLACPADWATPPTPEVSSSTRMVAIPPTCENRSATSCDWRCAAAAESQYVFPGNQPDIAWCCPAKLGATGATVNGVARAAVGTTPGISGNNTVTCTPVGGSRTFTFGATTITGTPILTAVPPRIRQGTMPTLRWDVTGTNLNQTTCTLSGPGINQVVTGTGNVTGTVAISVPTRYQLFCDDGAGGRTVYATVGILPKVREI